MRPSSCVLIGGGCCRLDAILDHLESDSKYWSYQKSSMTRHEAELKLIQHILGVQATHVTARRTPMQEVALVLDRDRRGISLDSNIFWWSMRTCSGIYSRSEYEYLDHSVGAGKLATSFTFTLPIVQHFRRLLRSFERAF